MSGDESLSYEKIYACIATALPATDQVVAATTPIMLFVLWIAVSLAIYRWRNRSAGIFLDLEMRSRGSSLLLGMDLRQFFVWLMMPLVRLLLRAGIPAHAITLFSALLAAGSAVAIAAGHFALGGWLLACASLCDYLDGRIARGSGTAGPQGAFLDSVLDRYVEGAVFVGLSWYYRETWVLFPVLLALSGSFLVSYVRARAEALGAKLSDVGLMQRPERLVVLMLSLVLAPVVEAVMAPDDPHPIFRITVVGILIIASATQFTALERLWVGMSRLSRTPLRGGVLGRGSVIRSTLAAAIATIFDFSLVYLLVQYLEVPPAGATFLGAVVGGILNFMIGRFWVFHTSSRYDRQGIRYAIVSVTGAGLNAGGVALFLLLPGLSYQISWTIVRCLVFLMWNHTMQRDWVFQHESERCQPLGQDT